jgi:DNA mismatch endonuclease (patch repair protein)
MDRITRKARSALMSKIRGKNTTPEIRIRKLLFSLGYRYRLHDKRLPGCPDIVFVSRKKAIFINGCFWHGHSCKRGAKPTSNTEFWELKISGTISRDRKNKAALRKIGWSVLTVWQCEMRDLPTLRCRLVEFLDKGDE